MKLSFLFAGLNLNIRIQEKGARKMLLISVSYLSACEV